MSFSPSQTRLYSRCAYKWYLEKYCRFVPQHLGKRELAAAVGTAVGAALEAYYKHNRSLDINTVTGIAEDRYGAEVAARSDGGKRTVYDSETEMQYSGFPRALVTEYFKNPQVPDDWQVTDVEARTSDDHESYIDLGGVGPRGRWIIDFKCKMNLKRGYSDGELLKYAGSSQLLQYVHEYQQRTQETVSFYRIVLLVASPITFVRSQDFEVNQAAVTARYLSNKRIWQDMDRAKKHVELLHNLDRTGLTDLLDAVPMASDHYDGIFKCEYLDHCLTGEPPVDVPGFVRLEDVHGA